LKAGQRLKIGLAFGSAIYFVPTSFPGLGRRETLETRLTWREKFWPEGQTGIKNEIKLRQCFIGKADDVVVRR